MIQIKKTILTLVALLAVTTGAWADETYPIVYDFEGAANASESFSNKNGSSANGQKFYAWENAEKPDNPRQDYKGYEWLTGLTSTYLPKVCHVWRRSDRPADNINNGGLQCPSNKEMAIDGLTAGLTVTIEYDATNAADGSKEIVWAIGDGTATGGPGSPRATATIDGVEAVPGQTTIASGAVITVNSVTEAENGSGYIAFAVKKDMVIKKIIIDEAKAGSSVTVDWNAAAKTGTFTMPGGNVELEPEYYPQATMTSGAVVAMADLHATVDAELVGIDQAKLTGASGLMFYVSTSATAPAYDAEGWTSDVPNAKDFTEACNLYIYYYLVGDDEHSDGDICENALFAEIGDAPTYAVEFAEGTDANEWKAEPATDVKKGQTVTVTYTGKKKVIGVKAEKKAKAPATVLSGAFVDGAVIKVSFKWRGDDISGDYVQGTYNADSGTFTVSKGGYYWGNDSRAVYKVEKSGNNITIGAGFSDYSSEGMQWTFNTETDTYTYTPGSTAQMRPNYYGLISVTLNGTDITSQLTQQ